MVNQLFFWKIRLLFFIATMIGASACNTPNSVTESKSTAATPAPATGLFQSGQKGVKILMNINTGGSFSNMITTTPTPSLVPPDHGGDNIMMYNPGISPTTYYDLDGVTAITKPAWLTDFQIGITHTPLVSQTCATFGGHSGNSYDAAGVYRVSESDCGAAGFKGVGNTADAVFFRAILNRDPSVIGSGENLMVQVEYQSSGIVPYSANLNSLTQPEDMVDQLWKVFWAATPNAATNMTPFATFVPPNYAFCGNSLQSPPGACSGPGPGYAGNNYAGSPVRTKQVIFPLSAFPSMSVLQFSRMHSWVSDGGAAATMATNFCHDNTTTTTNPGHDSPACLGVIVRSITLLRI